MLDVTDIRLLVSDVDGVLTDGTISYGTGNLEEKAFNIKDGLGLRLATWAEFPVAWLSGRRSDAVTRRAAELGVRLYDGVSDKNAGLRQVAAEHGVHLAQIAYVGDDLNDLPALALAGLPIAVADAVPEVKEAARYITGALGGHGAIREVVELLLRGQGRWEAAKAIYFAHLQGATAGQ
jgi:3-deoxy-D-manno-octulosonate 8-phosphate phosphatase (KDO 8-P phosphatase)